MTMGAPVFDYDAKKKQIRKIIASLPLLGGMDERVEFHASTLARDGGVLTGAKHAFKIRKTKDKSQKYLLRLSKAASSLVLVLQEMPYEAAEALGWKHQDVVNHKRVLIKLLINPAYAAIEKVPNVANRSPIPEFVAGHVAELALTAFEELTGRRATRVESPDYSNKRLFSPYEQLVWDLFSVMDIDKSPKVWARKAIKKRATTMEFTVTN
jgi:hypothetical protein